MYNSKPLFFNVMFLCTTDALLKYKQENGMQPDRVLVYRDGVGEGQIEHVRDHEIVAIEVKRVFSLHVIGDTGVVQAGNRSKSCLGLWD